MQVTLRQFVKELQHGISLAANNKSMQLGKGQCKDHAEYTKMVGFIAGLEAGGAMAKSMLSQLEEQAIEAEEKLPEMT